MPKCIIILPWDSAAGKVSLPGLTDAEREQVTGVTCGSYVPPPAGAPQYALVWLTAASQAVIDKLAAQSNCLLVCNALLDADGNQIGFETAQLTAAARNAVRTKIESFGFTGAKFGSLNAAIQASQNRGELAYKLATLAFSRDNKGNFMTEQQVRETA